MPTHLIIVENHERRRLFMAEVRREAHRQGRVDVYLDNGGRLRDEHGNRVIVLTRSEVDIEVRGIEFSSWAILDPGLELDARIVNLLESRRRE